MKPHLQLLLLGLAAALAVTGCTADWLNQAGLPALVSGRPEPIPSPPATYTIGPAALDAGLPLRDPYQTQFKLTFDGRRGGQPSAGVLDVVTTHAPASNALRVQQSLAGTLPAGSVAPGESQFVQIDGEIYVAQNGETIWFEPPAGQENTPADFGFLSPDRLAVIPATVSSPPSFARWRDIDVLQYTFTDQELTSPDLDFVTASGTLWLNPVAQTIVQYEISATVKIPAPPAGLRLFDEGSYQLGYRLTPAVAEPITPPGQAAGANVLAGLPRPPQTQVTAAFPALLEYTGVISPISATLFYREHLPAAGWTEETSLIFNEKARLKFSQADQAVTIIISALGESSQSKVVLNLEKLPGD